MANPLKIKYLLFFLAKISYKWRKCVKISFWILDIFRSTGYPSSHRSTYANDASGIKFFRPCTGIF
ncbi:hypothetical protein [Ornithobacterium rhinotracheale]|uniref:hypothetical protein n=1 Tax=Ornithobacterium rhinotracheale TaxID=28251 RepID=UPI0012DC34C1|nr:hypothetical protein [Ornithobacterium rhinotracheale]MCK0194344.1 hypothetical protein [Ornithobacterium rhinotracheale]MCK0199875.1 hypothetical protein [Ornithobacterium rhinotracheale]UOH64447.1 hypothetical protein MT993_04335 [Ornithobacterium rhinotracheale]UOH65530.1 hypothetical protein MT999_10065 [Ornithobacterium rhinotracheale]UVD88227.1 hypothetical protein NV236_05045 [Ornithobacterium rhinotracheale]